MTPARPSVLGGRRIVVCRSSDQATGLLESIGGLGGVGVALPLLEVAEPRDGGAALDRAAFAIESFDWLVLTSANAVSALAARCPHLPDALRVAVVGPATGRAAATNGWRIDFEPSVATGEALASELPFDSSSSRILAPLAELAADTIERVLRERGAVVDRIEAYRMDTPHHTDAQIGAALDADVVLLTSPSTADRFAAIAQGRSLGDGAATMPKAIVIGPSTEVAALGAGFDVMATADPHTEEGLLAALVRSIDP